jgi:hypothetical protein
MSLLDVRENAVEGFSGSDVPRPKRSSRRYKAAGVVAVLASVAVTPLLLGPGTGTASSHREAPLIAGLPQYDNTDVYAFHSPENDGTVTLVSDWIPFEEPSGGPNFYPFASVPRGSKTPAPGYDINIDNNGDGKADIVYRWTFQSYYRNPDTFLYNTGVVNHLANSTLNFVQTYTLTRFSIDSGNHLSIKVLGQGLPTAPSNTGVTGMPNYAQLRSEAVKKVTGGFTTFAGQSDDPFFLDLRVFDVLYGAGTKDGGAFKESGTDSLKHYNVNQVALKVPVSDLAQNRNAKRNPAVGIWSTTVARRADGSGVQVSRLGNPLVNELVVPVKLKDAFNSISPDVDHTIPAVVAKVKLPEVPMLIEKIYGIKAPAGPRADLVEVFLTGISKNSGGPIKVDLNSQLLNKDVSPSKFVPAEELRLNLLTGSHADPKRLGVLDGDTQGYPNGRRLTDDVVDIELQALEGALPPYARPNLSGLGDGVDTNDVPFTESFPYTPLPHAG